MSLQSSEKKLSEVPSMSIKFALLEDFQRAADRLKDVLRLEKTDVTRDSAINEIYGRLSLYSGMLSDLVNTTSS